MQISQNLIKKKVVPLAKLHLLSYKSNLSTPVIHKYTNSFFPTFSIYLLQLIHCYPSLCHMSATPFHLKQVQYVTILSNLNSLEGGAGEGGWVGVLKGQV